MRQKHVSGLARPNTAASTARPGALPFRRSLHSHGTQASAREALPAGRLKAAFEDNRRTGRLVDPAATSRVLYDILQADAYDNGAHADFYSATAAARAAAAAAEAEALHPLAAARAAAGSGTVGAAVAAGSAVVVSQA